VNTKPQTHLTSIGTKQYLKIIWQNPPKAQDHFKYVYFQMSKWFSFVNLGYRKNLFVLFRYIQKGTWVQFIDFKTITYGSVLFSTQKFWKCLDYLFQRYKLCRRCFSILVLMSSMFFRDERMSNVKIFIARRCNNKSISLPQ
jgi:hypothetical protein